MASEQTKRAVVLVSGGLDSTTVLAIARSENYECYTLSFDYGQRHKAELIAAKNSAKAHGSAAHKVVQLNLDSIGGSALTDHSIAVPEMQSSGIPVTYVPARNTVFLAVALGWAEVLQAEAIFIGVNAVDYSGYPDCRPEYIAAFQKLANLATKFSVEGHSLEIKTPLIHMSKRDIIAQGLALGVDYSTTVSCYQANDDGAACGRCDACRLRRDGFVSLGIADPTRYRV